MSSIVRLATIFVLIACCASAGDRSVPARKNSSTGLAAHYYRDPANWGGNWPDGASTPTVSPHQWTFSNYAYTRKEPLINHLFIRRGWFTVRWLGWLDTDPGHDDDDNLPEEEGQEVEFTFEVWADDGCRLFIDDQPVIDSWIPCSENNPAAHRTTTVRMAPGKHRIRIEYFQGLSLRDQDKDPIKLYWKCPALNIPRQIIPASHFFHTPADLAPSPGRLD